MAGSLVILSGPDAGKSFPVGADQTLVLGRGQASDTQINDPHLSRVHCRVEAIGGKIYLSDAGSTGGTLIKGQKIDRAELLSGSVFRVGETEIRFQSAASADQLTIQKPVGSLRDLMGTTISRYQLQSILHEGSNGIVFKGLDTEKKRAVAVKVLTPDPFQSEEQMERFVRAMKTMMPIRHPNIARIYFAGKTGPYCWAAMEFIDGESLSKVIEKFGVRGMLDWKEVFRVAVHITKALDEAYRQKIIHRNVTPNNIIQRYSDKACVLVDLMLAKALDGTLAKQVTQPGQIVGTLPYLSPERTRDEASVDHRSDLYGLGATLYALLTGRPPFVSASLMDLIVQIRDAVPKEPKEFQLSVNERFQGMVMQLLHKRPEDRYQTPDDVLVELERIAKFNNLSMD